MFFIYDFAALAMLATIVFRDAETASPDSMMTITRVEVNEDVSQDSETFTAPYRDLPLDLLITLLHMEQSMLSNSTTKARNFSYCDKKPKFVLGSGSLLVYMLRNNLCQLASNRTWFQEACVRQPYAITPYHQAVYVKFCDPVTFRHQCGGNSNTEPESVVRLWMQERGISEIGHPEKTRQSRGKEFAENNIINQFHCDAIESFFDSVPLQENKNSTRSHADGNESATEPFHDTQYTEWLLMYRPFCPPVGCGVARQNYKNHSLSAYDCFPSACKIALLVVIVIDSILAALVVFANSMVLVVAFRNSFMKTVPGYFKISLAVADLMVGLFVLPGCVYNHYVLSIHPLPYRKEGQRPHVSDYFDQKYLDIMGIFTVLSFAISVYTMGVASVDRYLAITRPFQYRRGKYFTKKRSISIFAVIWLFGFSCAIYPVLTKSSYNVSALGLILASGSAAALVYAVTLGLPLLLVWVINGVMLRQVCSEKKNRRSLSRKAVMNRSKTLSENYRKSRQSTVAETLEGQVAETISVGDDDVFEKEGNSNCNSNMFSGKFPFQKRTETRRKSSQLHGILKFTASVGSKIKKQVQRSSSSDSVIGQYQVERKMARTLAVMVGAFTAAILPSVIVIGTQLSRLAFISPHTKPETFSPSVLTAYTSAQYIASRLLLSNSFWNCIIYSIRNRHFRQAFVDAIVCSDEKRRRRRSRSASGTAKSSSLPRRKSRHLSKTISNDSGCVLQQVASVSRKSNQKNSL